MLQLYNLLNDSDSKLFVYIYGKQINKYFIICIVNFINPKVQSSKLFGYDLKNVSAFYEYINKILSLLNIIIGGMNLLEEEKIDSSYEEEVQLEEDAEEIS